MPTLVSKINRAASHNNHISPKVQTTEIFQISQKYQRLQKMEKIFSNPGLQHLAENIFWNLDVKDLKICVMINQSCNQIFKHPFFCLRKFHSLKFFLPFKFNFTYRFFFKLEVRS